VLTKEPELVRAGDSAKLQKMLKRIPGAIDTNSGLYACGEYATLKDHYNISDLQHRCDDIKPQIEAEGPEFECFLKASEEKCANPPEDVGRGPVRRFYELLHKASACGEITKDPVFTAYSRDMAIRLVFAREVQKNFGKIYGKNLAEVDEILAKLGAPESLRFSDIGQLTRRDLLRRADELLAFLDKMKGDPFQDPAEFEVNERDGEIASLRQFQQNLTSVMTQLHPRCVPFNWTEPDQKEKSACVRDEWIGRDGVKSFLKPESGLRSSMLARMSADLTNQAEAMEKVSGSKPDAATVAKIVEYQVQAEKLRYFGRYDKEMPPDYSERIALREKYARTVRTLAEKGVAQPQSDPAAVKVMLEVNRPEVEAVIASIRADIGLAEQKMNVPDLSEEDRGFYEDRIKAQRDRLQNEEAALETTKLLTSEGGWDSTMGKAQRLHEIQDALGRRLRDADVESKSANVEMYKMYLREMLPNAADKLAYETELKAAQAELKALKEETATQLRQRGNDFITRFRGKY
jgi:hypothetical protein